MIKIDFNDLEVAPRDWSDIFEYKEDLASLESKIKKIAPEPVNVISVGNGGSITSFDAFSYALNPKTQVASVWTMDPQYLLKTKEKFSKENTVVVAVSKSGTTLGQIEALMYFKDYKVICVTNPEKGSLQEIARKMNWEIIEHPPVGGRFSGGTSSTFVPAMLSGIDCKKIQDGMAQGYQNKNLAYTLSKYYFDLEQQGYNEVYVTCYSEALSSFENLIVQLMHESVCKNSKGQTFYFSMGPEAQHHTNQRFIGGKRNVIGTFILSESANNEKIEIPKDLWSIDYKGKRLEDLNQIPYKKALEAEYLGTKGDADEKSIPNVTIKIDKICEQSVGELVSFWHLVAFYSSLLRDVNPFDQPAVERSKDITLDILLK
ncbi:MAG: Glucose-6-phosphate isomerase [candidate division WS2 bacterium ADurb.Bin280]|uniref:Glucose-6-phosphate isomerase n=1 Tax=candidate division WS2 bacterium ADurb.Bin280 TaxID=1852829 RepID=A0A1V5SCB2_9BACT|nr:MAG: Glucose-6-phosphate isomerase [candidate division WS2 bacterium ADurb.Bin280]